MDISAYKCLFFVINRIDVCSYYVAVTCGWLTVTSNYFAFDISYVSIKIMMSLQKASFEIISKFTYNLVAVTILTYLVRIAPNRSATDINIIFIDAFFIYHNR